MYILIKNDRYETIVTQITHDVGLTLFQYTDWKFLPHRELDQCHIRSTS